MIGKVLLCLGILVLVMCLAVATSMMVAPPEDDEPKQ